MLHEPGKCATRTPESRAVRPAPSPVTHIRCGSSFVPRVAMPPERVEFEIESSIATSSAYALPQMSAPFLSPWSCSSRFVSLAARSSSLSIPASAKSDGAAVLQSLRGCSFCLVLLPSVLCTHLIDCSMTEPCHALADASHEPQDGEVRVGVHLLLQMRRDLLLVLVQQLVARRCHSPLVEHVARQVNVRLLCLPRHLPDGSNDEWRDVAQVESPQPAIQRVDVVVCRKPRMTITWLR
mgnify:CR=1 FL=1